jgi:hypothetical protein
MSAENADDWMLTDENILELKAILNASHKSTRTDSTNRSFTAGREEASKALQQGAQVAAKCQVKQSIGS